MSSNNTGPREALHPSVEGGGGDCSLELYVPSLPHLPSTKGTLPHVSTHKEFLGHCWVHHDNCVINKAFLLGILPFTVEGATVKGGRNKGTGRVDGAKELGRRRLK